MRRIAIAVALTALALWARALAPKLHARLLAACEHILEQTPDSFPPPKRMMRGIEEIRANTARTLELLEQANGAEPIGDASSPRAVGHLL